MFHTIIGLIIRNKTMQLLLLGCWLVPNFCLALEVGQVIEPMQMKTLSGGQFSLPSNDKNTLVQVWASWCPFCRRQNGYLEEFVKRTSKNSINIITISIDKTPQIAKSYMATNSYTFEAAMMTPELSKAIGKIRGIPILFILDKNNQVIYKEVGEIFEEDFLLLDQYKK